MQIRLQIFLLIAFAFIAPYFKYAIATVELISDTTNIESQDENRVSILGEETSSMEVETVTSLANPSTEDFTKSGSQAGKQCYISGENSECTLMLLKPDALHRGLVGEIISRIEKTGFKMVATKLWAPSREHVALHYEHLEDKPFFPDLLEYITSGQVMAIVWRGPSVVHRIRNIAGHTDPVKALPGTIRGDLASSVDQNLVHSSDSIETAKREIQLWGLW